MGLLVFLNFLGWLDWAESGAGKVLDPVLNRFYGLSSGIRNAYERQIDKEDWAGTKRRLEAEINRLTEENAKLKITEEENKLLREHLRFLTKNDYQYLIGNVIAKGSITESVGVSDSIVIDRGEEDGLRAGLPVLSSQGILIGKIAEVKTSIATVDLTNSKRCKTAATVLNSDKTSGITEGELGLTINMNFIPQNTVINIGDLVVTSGLEENIPRGLVIGKVAEVKKENNALWQQAVIEPLSGINESIIVSVLLP